MGASDSRYKKNKRNDVEVSIDEWIENSYLDFMEDKTEMLDIGLVFFVPLELDGEIEFLEYKQKIVSLIETKFSKTSGLIVKMSYYYSSNDILQKYLNSASVI